MTPERMEAVLVGMRLGLSRTVAAQAAGVGKDAIRRWALVDRRFALALEEAEGTAQAMLMRLVLQAAAKGLPNTWQAAAWMLERRWPDQYGQKSKLDVSLDVHDEARRIAEEMGLDPIDVIAEAEGILATHRPKRDPE